MRAAYRLLAPGLVAAAFASPAAAAPAKAQKAQPKAQPASKGEKAGKNDKGKEGEKAGKNDKGKKGEKAKPGAEPAQGEAKKGAKPEETKGTGGQEEQSSPAPAASAKPQAASSAAGDAGLASDESKQKKPPPPPPPRADEQEPRPYLKLPEPEKPSRKVELGPHAGVEYLPASGSGISYGAGFAWGGHARIALAPWLGLRVSFTQSSQPVSVPDGALGLPAGTHIDQPDLSVLLLRLRVEPTWVVSPRFRLWAGVGAGWGRISAPAVTTSGAQAGLHSASRKGVMVEFAGELGASFDVIPNWLAVSLMGSGGVLTNQTGEVFRPSQAFTADGHRIQLDGLPHFGSSLSALLGVGVLL